jgi:predicted dehydrogenase
MSMKRRDFLKKSALVGAGCLILPRISLAGPRAPGAKLNVALIGVWGRGQAHYGALKGENVVALCDIDENKLAGAAKVFPGAKTYVDWRKCLEQKDIEAVVCCTTDHTHAFIAAWAMNRGMHVYCEKPLANSVEEARVVREIYLKNKDKLATQVGTQRHADRNFDRVEEAIRDGAVGTLQSAFAWGNRKLGRPAYLPAEGSPPAHLHYDLWLGPSPAHPYNPGYFSGGSGANCLQWNMFWDFGSGQVGDMGSHTMDLVWNAVDAKLPTSAEAIEGDPFNPDVTPVKLATRFQFPANDWRPAISVSWYQGGAMPSNPREFVNLSSIGHGAMFKGDKGLLVCDFTSRVIIPYGNDADLTYFKRRTKEELIAPMGGFQEQWINACKGDLKTSCNFDYAGNMIEMMLLGLVAYRAGKKISYDGAAGRVTDSPEADALLKRKYRDGWVLNG